MIRESQGLVSDFDSQKNERESKQVPVRFLKLPELYELDELGIASTRLRFSYAARLRVPLVTNLFSILGEVLFISSSTTV